MHKLAVGVLGASGYTGRELCALVARHPGMELAFAAANEQRGKTARLGGRDVAFVAAEDAPLHTAGLVFSALPHGASAEWVLRARDAGARVVDLSSDLRPGNGAASAKGAQVPYGLTELTRNVLRDAAVVANPGCYPTAVLIALAPLLASGLVLAGATITVNAASGVTGAGFTPRPELMFAEVAEDFRAYAVGNTHRHLAEMKSVAADLGGDADILFTPHLLPVSRGILATIAVPVVSIPNDVLSPWRETYAGEPFVEVVAEPPTLKDVVHRNVVRISAVQAAGVRQPTLMIFAAIDNLMKGAAGQAVQNANAVLGFPEPLGLPA
ncbi:MAG TPA: N-acetyl-gamma-glutamyl-phosphate reductase [Gemmatimonadaceae bacterium]|nr:N-acetyl-gamma-glutamyl-phosphate reductase [Gemmatimonadaceae bacterium]